MTRHRINGRIASIAEQYARRLIGHVEMLARADELAGELASDGPEPDVEAAAAPIDGKIARLIGWMDGGLASFGRIVIEWQPAVARDGDEAARRAIESWVGARLADGCRVTVEQA